MRCIVINLQRAHTRRQAITRQLDSLSMEFELLEAVDWRSLGHQERMLVDLDARNRDGRRPLSDGMIACHLSHLKAIERVASGNDEFVTIFEDDVVLMPQIRTIFSILESARELTRSFDVLFLHRNRTERLYVPLYNLNEVYSVGTVKYSDSGALSYIISKHGAERFLECYPKIVHQIDHALHGYWENELKIVSLNPPVVLHGEEGVQKSFVREAAATRPRRPVLSYPRRIRSIVREEALKRLSFSQLYRTAGNAHCR